MIFFDLDGTLTKNDTLVNFSFFAIKQGYLKFVWFIFLFILLKLKLISNQTMKKLYAKLCLKGYDEEILRKLSRKWFNLKGKKLLRKRFLNKYLKYQRIIVSSNFDFLVKLFANYLNIKHYISISLEIKKKKYTGNILGEVPYGKNKLNYLKNLLNYKKLKISTAYGDDNSDIFLLKTVKKGILLGKGLVKNNSKY